MSRREFIKLICGLAAWPLAARAQQSDHMRRIAYLTTGDETDPEPQGWLANFKRSLRETGWIESRDVRIDVRFGGGDSNLLPRLAKELIQLQPDVILAATRCTVRVRS